MHPKFEEYKNKINEKLAITTPSAIGVAKIVAEAAQAACIARQIVTVIDVSDMKAETVKVPVAAINAGTIRTDETFDASSADNETYSYVSVTLNQRAFVGANWTADAMEMLPFDVFERQLKAAGYELGRLETKQVISAIESATTSNTFTVSGHLTVDALVDAVSAIKAKDYNPTVIIMHPTQYADLLKDEKFVNSLYMGDPTLPTGIRSVLLGCDILVTSLCTAGKVHVLDKERAAVLAIVAEPDVQEWEKPEVGKFGIRGRQRFGVAVLVGDAIARITVS